MRLVVTFSYVGGGKKACIAGRGATAAQLTDKDVQLDAEQVVSSQPAAWRHVFALMQCPGAPCDRGHYCWQDSDSENRHYRLIDHHLKALIRHVQRGDKLDTYNDVPEEIKKQLHAKEQQHLNRK